jgi:SNF2 family DNA or RNA helicase
MSVDIEIVDGRIAARIPWNGGRGRDLAKSVPGYKAQYNDNGQFQYWTYPLAMSTCRVFRQKAGDALRIGPLLSEWAWDQRRAEEEMEKLRAGGSADLPRVRAEAPALWEALQTRPFQITGAAFVTQGRSVCLGDAPRLGKTYQALAAIVETGVQSVLIASPKTAVRSVWYRKIQQLLGEEAYVAQGTRAQREAAIAKFQKADGRRFLLINLEMIRVRRIWTCPDGTSWRIHPGRKGGCQEGHKHATTFHSEYPELFDTVWDGVVLDESHHALASQYNKQSANITQIRMGAVRLPIRPDGLRLASSGTPFRSKLKKSWGTLNWLRPDVFTSFWQFAETHLGVTTGEWGQKVVGDELLNEEAFHAAIAPYYLARTKTEVAPYLPPVAYAGSPPAGKPDGPVGVYLPMEPEQAKAYRSIKEDAAAKLENGTLFVNGVLPELTRMRQFATAYGKLSPTGQFVPALPSNKLEWIMEYLREMVDAGPDGKVVIASQFTQVVKLFADAIRKEGYEVLTLTGETTDRQRLHVQDQFLTGRPRIIIINLLAGGEAIDLSSADELILIDEPWVDDARQQVENRVQNLAKRNQVTIHRLRSEGTVEESIAAMTDEQRRILTSATPKAKKLAKELIGA